jgi:hypothetical protein
MATFFIEKINIFFVGFNYIAQANSFNSCFSIFLSFIYSVRWAVKLGASFFVPNVPLLYYKKRAVTSEREGQKLCIFFAVPIFICTFAVTTTDIINHSKRQKKKGHESDIGKSALWRDSDTSGDA